MSVQTKKLDNQPIQNRFLPDLTWLPRYERACLRADALAGLAPPELQGLSLDQRLWLPCQATDEERQERQILEGYQQLLEVLSTRPQSAKRTGDENSALSGSWRHHHE